MVLCLLINIEVSPDFRWNLSSNSEWCRPAIKRVYENIHLEWILNWNIDVIIVPADGIAPLDIKQMRPPRKRSSRPRHTVGGHLESHAYLIISEERR